MVMKEGGLSWRKDDAARARADTGVRRNGSKHPDDDDVRQHQKPNRVRRAPASDASTLCADGEAPLTAPHGGRGEYWLEMLKVFFSAFGLNATATANALLLVACNQSCRVPLDWHGGMPVHQRLG